MVFGGSEREGETIAEGRRDRLENGLDRQGGDVGIAQIVAAAAQGRAEKLDEVAARQPSCPEAKSESLQIIDPKGLFQFGQRAERQAQRVARAGDVERDLAAPSVGHGTSSFTVILGRSPSG